MLSVALLSLIMGCSAVAGCLVPGTFAAWFLARRHFPGKPLAETALMLPLIIPPVVTGYLLIVLMGSHSWFGEHVLAPLGIHIVFTRFGMAVAAGIMGFPLFVITARAGFENVPPELETAAQTLGCSALGSFFRITLPIAWPGIAAGAILAFARALGEFGATAMVSPGTDGYRTIPLDIFRNFQIPGREKQVLILACISILISVMALTLSGLLSTRYGFSRRAAIQHRSSHWRGDEP